MLDCGSVSRKSVHAFERGAAPPWLVVYDPSGDFAGRRFRLMDLVSTTEWDDGTIFWHTERGDLRIWHNGAYRALNARRKRRKP